jgi:cytidylate kinase
MIVAIDGPAGAGKSTVARLLAERLGFRYVDTGAMYRALTWLALEHGVGLDDEATLAELARESPVSLEGDRVEIAGRDVSAAIRTTRVDRNVSAVARHPAVRAIMRKRQREVAAEGDSVLEGRDTGSVVCPDADLKVYLVAAEAERARRRAAEQPGASRDDLRRRDERDAAQLAPAPDATEIDTTRLSAEEVVERIAGLVAARA